MAGVKIGLKDLHVSIMNEDGKYEVPVKLAKAIEATITPNVNNTTLYADDQASEVAEALGDVDVELTIDDLSSASYALIMGKTAKADGVIVDTSNDVAPYLALGFRSLKSNGAYRYIWLYKGKFSIPTDSYATKGDQVDFQNQTISGKFVANDDGEWRARVDSDDVNADATVIDDWFKAVYPEIPMG